MSQISVEHVIPRLVGLGDWRRRASEDGYNDAYIDSEIIPAAIRHFERAAQFRVEPVRIVMAPDGVYPQSTSAYPLVELEMVPYVRPNAQAYLRFHVPEGPIRQLLRVRVMLNRSSQIFEIPSQWLEHSPYSGDVWIQPTSGSLTAAAAFGFNILNLAFGVRDDIPHSIAIDYDAGLPDGWVGLNEWKDVARAVTCRAAIMICSDWAQAFDAGRSSVSASGLGVAVNSNLSRFEDRIGRLEQEEKAIIDQLRAQMGRNVNIGFI